MNVNKEIQTLRRAFNAYNDRLQNLAEKIRDKVDFEFDIHHQPGDGFVLIDIDQTASTDFGSDISGLAPLDYCLQVISDKGKLSQEDFDSNRI